MIKILFAIEQLYYDFDDTLSTSKDKNFYLESNPCKLFVFFHTF